MCDWSRFIDLHLTEVFLKFHKLDTWVEFFKKANLDFSRILPSWTLTLPMEATTGTTDRIWGYLRNLHRGKHPARRCQYLEHLLMLAPSLGGSFFRCYYSSETVIIKKASILQTLQLTLKISSWD